MTQSKGGTEGFEILRELCSGQMLAVLATESARKPYANLVAIAVTSDLREFYFATQRSTRKWANLTGNHHVALLIDNRTNQVVDFTRAAAATVLGIAEELTGKDLEEGLKLYLARHPHLAGFVRSPNCALFKVRVEKVYLVNRFQNVLEFHFPS